MKMATAGGGGGGGRNVKGTISIDGTAKSTVTEQISQAVQSTSNLLHLMQQSSPSQTQLMKLPKNLLAKTPTIKNTGQMLEQMPRVISLLDAHIESGLQSVPHLKTVIQLLENMESCQLSSLSQAHFSQGESQHARQHPEVVGCSVDMGSGSLDLSPKVKKMRCWLYMVLVLLTAADTCN